jgi:hypothetical protein
MTAKQIDVTCPCCSARLTVDVLTSQVLRRSQPEEKRTEAGSDAKDRWSSAQERVRDRTKTGEEKLASGLEHERTKAKKFDDLFDKAREKHTRNESEDPES